MSIFDYLNPQCKHVAGTPCNIRNIKDVAKDIGMDCNGVCCWGCMDRKLCGAACNVSKSNTKETEYKEPPILLHEGDVIYKVLRGEIEEKFVLGENWTYGENKRGYRLKDEDGRYDVTSNSAIGKGYYTDYTEALLEANENMKRYDIILSKSIKPIETIAYHYIREVDKREMIAFYSILDNGMMYAKQFMTFHYMVQYNKKNINTFMDQSEFAYGVSPQQFNYSPKYKNMYRCRAEVNWLYAEARYSEIKMGGLV